MCLNTVKLKNTEKNTASETAEDTGISGSSICFEVINVSATKYAGKMCVFVSSRKTESIISG